VTFDSRLCYRSGYPEEPYLWNSIKLIEQLQALRKQVPGATDVRFYDFKSDGRETQLITEVTVNKLIPAEPVIILWSPIPGNAAPESGR